MLINIAPTNPGEQDAAAKEAPAFCHAFDLTKRLTHPSITNMSFIPVMPSKESPFPAILKRLQTAITSSAANTIHRIVIPSLLNPTIYPPNASQPEHVLQFFHALKALMSAHNTRDCNDHCASVSLSPFVGAGSLDRTAQRRRH